MTRSPGYLRNFTFNGVSRREFTSAEPFTGSTLRVSVSATPGCRKLRICGILASASKPCCRIAPGEITPMAPTWLLRLLALPLGIALWPVAAQDYPSKSLRLIVPVAPGGGTDILARLLARKLGDLYGQQVVVDNRPGAGTVIGSDLLAKSPPDGYTLSVQINALAANHTLYAKLPYDTLKDFAPVVLVASTPNVLVAHPSLPAKSVRQFVSLARARPGEIAYASSGVGGAAYLATEMLKLHTGIKMIHVPYKGTVPALTAIISGEAQVMVAALPGAIPFIKAGRVRALGVTGAQRAAATPELPTMIEAGLPGYEFSTWYGVFAPGGTPRDIVAKLNAAVTKMLAQQDFRAQLAREGLDPVGGTPEAFDTYFRAEVEKLGAVIRASGATAD
jgi:tripartite-type tricarboxylate transporter receptor subunit TctC